MAAEAKAALIAETISKVKGSSEMAFSGVFESWLLPVIEIQDSLREVGNVVPARHVLATFTADIVQIIRCPRNALVAFKSFFRRVSDDPKFGHAFKNICGGVVDLLFETLVASIEDGSDGAAKFILAALVVVVDDRVVGAGKHFRLICSMILSEDCETVEHALKLARLCLHGEDRLLYRQAPDLCSNLVRLAFRGSESIVRGSLECLFEISKTSTQIKSQLLEMYRKMSSFIDRKATSNDAEVVLLLCRGVYAVSLITRMGRDFAYEWPISLAGTSELIRKARENPHKALGVFCSMAAAELLVSDPMASLQEPLCGIIKDGFEHGSDSAQLALLKGFHGMLIRDRSTIQTSTFSDDPVARLDYSSSLCTVFQSFVDHIQRSSQSTSPEVVESACLLLATMLRQGLSHPQNIVSYILALWQCPWPSVAQRIHEVCVEVVEASESYVLVTLELTVRLAYAWYARIRSESKGFIVDENGELHSHLSPLYEALKSKTKRQELVSVLLRELERSETIDLDYLKFIAGALSELPFKTLEEVAFVERGSPTLLPCLMTSSAGTYKGWADKPSCYS